MSVLRLLMILVLLVSIPPELRAQQSSHPRKGDPNFSDPDLIVFTPSARHLSSPRNQGNTSYQAGDVFVGLGGSQVGEFTPTGSLVQILDDGLSGGSYTTGMAFDSSGSLYVTNFGLTAVSKFDSSGNLLNASFINGVGVTAPESIIAVDGGSTFYIGGPDTATIDQFNNSGGFIQTLSVIGGNGTNGTDWTDSLNSSTVLYDGQGTDILSYDAATNTQNPDFVDGLPSQIFAFQVIPSGSFAGDVLVADSSNALLLSSSGSILTTYSFGSECDFSLSLDPSGTAFWTADLCSGEVWEVDIGTGTILEQWSAGPSGAGGGIAVFAGVTNPVPFITQPLVPDATAPGGPGFALTVNGAGFVSGATVDWNGAALATNFVNNEQLTATVPAANISAAGTASLTVVNPAPGGTSNFAFFPVTIPIPSFAFSRTDYATGLDPFDVAVGDLNGDGKLDLAVTNNGLDTGNTISVLLGNGDGTFQPQSAYTVGNAPFGIATADFNNDGKLDLAVTNAFDDTVSILLGNGDGTFQGRVDYTVGIDPFSVATADFNADGKLDLAVVDANNPGTVSVLLGNGDGSFQTQVTYNVDSFPYSVAVADFNGDNHLDLAIVNEGSNTISVLLGNGDGSFESPVDYGTGSEPYSVTAADFNGDDRLDLAVTNNFDSTVSVLLGNGDGTFQDQMTFPTGLNPQSVSTGDLNGDGKVDLVTANYSGNTVSILLGNGDGTFQGKEDVPTAIAQQAVAVGDFNDDGKLDLATAGFGSNTVSALLQIKLTPTFSNLTPSESIPYGTSSISLSGTICAGSSCPPSGETVTITINGASISPTIGSGGSFSASFNTATIPASSTPYPINYSYSGDANFNAANDSSKTLTVNKASTSFTGLTPSQSIVVGTPSITLSGTICAGSVCPPAGETVTITINSIPATATIGGNGSFSTNFNTSTIPASSTPYTISYSYGGDSDFGSATDSSTKLTVNALTYTVTLSPSTLSFGSVAVGTVSAAQPATLMNTGTGVLSITSIATSADFSETNNCGTSLNVGASCTINVTFTPSVAAAESGTLSVTDSATNSPQTVSLSGTGTGAVPSLSPASLSFSGTLVGSTSTAMNVTLTNNGNAPLTISGSPQLSGADAQDFAQTNTCSSSVAPGANCTVSVTFTPSQAGTRTATLTIPGVSQPVGLTGQGLPVDQPCGTYTFNRADCATGQSPVFVVADYDFNGDGLDDLAVVNSASDSVSILLSGLAGSFSPGVEYPTGHVPTGAAAGDFNGDGISDLAIVNSADNSVTILNGIGDGTFQTPGATFSTGHTPVSIVTGDFNNDGKLDLGVTNSADGTVGVLLGNGDGTFQTQKTTQVGTQPVGLAAGHINSDNNLDLAIVNSSDGTVSVLLGNGDGTFQAASGSPLTVGSNPVSVVLADFNGDGKTDLGAANSGSNNISVLFGNGDGTFQAPATYSTGNQPSSVTAGDYTGSGSIDLATANAVDGTVSVLLNNGDGTFPTGATGKTYLVYSVGSSPASIAMGNFNGGPSPDLAVADQGANEVTSLLNKNDGSGAFGPQTNSQSGGGSPDAVVMADFNGDGTPDLTVINNGTANGEVLLGPTYSSTLAFSTGTSPVAFAAGDFNNDGKQDLAIVNQGDTPPTVSILLGDGDGTFCGSVACPPSLTVASDPTSVAMGDFNLDGKFDLAVTIGNNGGTDANSVLIFLGNGDGTFGAPASFGSGGTSASAVTVADFNGDGKPDLAITNQGSNTVTILLGKGDGTFLGPVIYNVGLLPSAVAAGYLSGQTGQPDLVIANYCGNPGSNTGCGLGNPTGNGTITVLLNNRNGMGTFGTPGVSYTVGPGPTSIALGNYNPSNAFVDIAVAESGTGASGPSHFGLTSRGKFSKNVPGGGGGQSSSGLVGVLLGTGTGSLQPPMNYSSGGGNPIGVASGTSSSGQTVLGVANQGSNTVSVFVNTPAFSISATNLNFGSVAVGMTASSKTVTISNPGSAPLTVNSITSSSSEFPIQTNSCPVQPNTLTEGGSCSVTLTFAPSSGGSQTASLTASYTLGASATSAVVALSGSGSVQLPTIKSLALSPTTVTGGNNSTGTVTLSAAAPTGGTAVNLTSSNTGAAQVPSAGSVMVAAGAKSATFTVTTTKVASQTSATITASYNATSATDAITVTPVVGASLSPPNYNFGSVPANTTSGVETFTLTNSGSGALSVTSITPSSGFALMPMTSDCSTSSTVAANSSCTIHVVFKPTAEGAGSGTLTVVTSAGTFTASLSGTGTQPSATFSLSGSVLKTPYGVVLPSVLVGQTSSPEVLTIQNTGNANLTISSIKLTGVNGGDFTETGTCASVAPAGSCPVNLTFKPQAGGSRSATMTITDNAPGSPQVISLSGAGQDFIVTPSGEATLSPGQTATYTVTLTSQGGFQGTVSLTCTEPSDLTESTCTISPSSATLNGSSATSVKATVTTTAPSMTSRSRHVLPPVSPLGRPLGTEALWVIVLSLLGTLALANARRARQFWIVLGITVLAVLLWASCGGGGAGGGGGGGGNQGTPAGTYHLTVTAASGSLQPQTVTLELDVN